MRRDLDQGAERGVSKNSVAWNPSQASQKAAVPIIMRCGETERMETASGEKSGKGVSRKCDVFERPGACSRMVSQRF